MLRTALFATLLSASTLAHAAAPTVPTFDRAALQADVDLLVQAYTALHPGIHRYNTPAQFDAHVAGLRKALDGKRDLRQSFLAFSEFAATIRCGHTYPNPHNQTDAIAHALFDGDTNVPFEFRWLDGRMVVTRDLTPAHALPKGTEVVSIDGVPAPKLLATLLPIARADGHNDGKRIALLEVQGTEKFETFDVYLPLYFPQIDATQTLVVRAPTGERRTLDVKGLTHAQRLAARHDADDAPQAGWSLDVSDPHIAILRMPTWALYDSKWDWKAFLAESFNTLHADPRDTLVIDLRGNEGGLDVGDEILPHLIDAPITMTQPPRKVRYRKVPDALAPRLDTWDPSFKDWGAAAQDFDGRYYTLHQDDETPGTTTYPPRAPRFAGRVFVLVGPTNSSATFQFAQQVREHHLGTLVGRTTGGNQRGINGGAFFFLRLPNTGIELDLPLIGRFVEGAPDGGLAPDIAVATTLDDIVAGRDPELAAVRNAPSR